MLASRWVFDVLEGSTTVVCSSVDCLDVESGCEAVLDVCVTTLGSLVDCAVVDVLNVLCVCKVDIDDGEI